MEIIFTSLRCISDKNRKLIGNTSIWMFPIYGMASFLKPVCSHMKDKSLLKRGSVYTLCIFTGEYLTGSFLKRFEAGLLFEKILCRH